MSNVKISQLPVVTSVVASDVLAVVASTTTSQLSVTDLANSMPTVTSSLSASYYDFAGTNIVSSSLQFDDLTTPFTGSFTGSFDGEFIGDGSQLTGIIANAFPYTGDAQITGSLVVSGSTTTIIAGLIVTGSAKVNTNTYALNTYASSFQPYNGSYGNIPLDPVDSSETASAALSWWGSNQGAGVAFGGPGEVYFSDQNIGQIGLLDTNTFNRWAGAIKFLRNNAGMNVNTGKVPYYTLITDNATLIDGNATFSLVAANGRNHVLTVTGSILSKDGVTLGTSLANTHFITGSVNATGSYTQNGFTILTTVSQNLNFADDTAAAAGGVPLGGLYRNGNIVCIRIS